MRAVYEDCKGRWNLVGTRLLERLWEGTVHRSRSRRETRTKRVPRFHYVIRGPCFALTTAAEADVWGPYKAVHLSCNNSGAPEQKNHQKPRKIHS